MTDKTDYNEYFPKIKINHKFTKITSKYFQGTLHINVILNFFPSINLNLGDLTSTSATL